MARNDFYYEHVRKALENDGWTITHTPLALPYDDTTIECDFGAEKLRTCLKIIYAKNQKRLRIIWQLVHKTHASVLCGVFS